MRMAASPASMHPRAHDAAVTRLGLIPLMAHNSRLSTTARMATPRPRPPEEHAQAKRHANCSKHGGDLVPRDDEAGDGDGVPIAPQTGQGAQLDAPYGEGEALEGEKHGEGHDELGGHRRAGEQPTHHRHVEEHADERSDDPEGHEQGERRGPPWLTRSSQ